MNTITLTFLLKRQMSGDFETSDSALYSLIKLNINTGVCE